VTAAADGTVGVPVNLVKRLVITLTKGAGVAIGDYIKALQRFSIRPFGTGVAFIIPATGTAGSSITIYSQQGRLIWKWDGRGCSAQQQILWPGTGESNHEPRPGVYCAKIKIGDISRTAAFALVR
jgi:hypothetical protein